MDLSVDIIFISFKEANCEHNWARVKELHPDAIRVHGVSGIDRVHLLCNQVSTSEYFWTVDGDNFLTKHLVYTDPVADLTMFKAMDPIHQNLTLLGGVKLWRTGSIINTNMDKGDFCLNATKSKRVVEDYFSETRYNVSEFDTWKTSFRHCVKLLSVIFKNRPNATNINTYVDQWRNSVHSKAQFSEWAYIGYVDASNYVKLHDNNMEQLFKINNYQWLKSYFGGLYESS